MNNIILDESEVLKNPVATALEVRDSARYQADVYVYWFKHGWMTVTICDRTGEFMIRSDWGNYSHWWPMNCRGKESLREFIVDADREYLANKFSYEMPRDFREEFDIDATIQEIKRAILEKRRSGLSEASDARYAWDLLNEADQRTADEFYHWLEENDFGLVSGINVDYDFFRYQKSSDYLFLQNTLIPFIQEELRKECT